MIDQKEKQDKIIFHISLLPEICWRSSRLWRPITFWMHILSSSRSLPSKCRTKMEIHSQAMLRQWDLKLQCQNYWMNCACVSHVRCRLLADTSEMTHSKSINNSMNANQRMIGSTWMNLMETLSISYRCSERLIVSNLKAKSKENDDYK